MITAALIFWFIYVLPKTTSFLKGMDISLPFITKVLIAVGEFTQSYWYLIPLLPLIVFLLLKALYQRPTTRYYVDLAKIKIPVIKLIIHNKLLALFAEQLRIMTVAGITIDRAFDIVAQIIGNEVFKRAIIDSREKITGGLRISDALRKHKNIFPLSVVNLIRAGEESGKLEEQFAYIAEYYEKKLDDISEKMGKIIEPFIIVTLGLIFMFIIIALLYPIYQLVISIGTLSL
jgi:general secretion pathway protein F/type IV pilus assembly protein PilC